MPPQSTSTNRKDGLCLLSLDAGGARGISQLAILAELMHRLNFGAGSDSQKRPRDVFDMITGVGTGGFIAIILVVFGLSTEKASDVFAELSIDILENRELDAQSRTAALRKYIDNLLEKHDVDKEKNLLDLNDGSANCKLVIPIAYKRNIGTPCILRNFNSRQGPNVSLTIAETMLATLATPPLFTSISIVKNAFTFEYVGGDLTLTNPTSELITEAYDAFGPERQIACLVSIGCGHPGVVHAPEGSDIGEWNRFLVSIAVDSEQKSRSTDSQIGHLGLYHRFHVTQGLEQNSNLGVLEPGEIITHTAVYLADPSLARKVTMCVDSLKICDGTVSLEQLKHPGGQRVVPLALPPLTRTFVMRKKPWEFVETALLGEVDSDEQRILVVTGIGGCGKTQLILKFLRVYSGRFISSFFVDGSSESRIRADIIRNIRSLGTENSQMTFEECLFFLSQPSPNGSHIILYDNVDDPEVDITSLLPDGNGCAIVITSRNRSMGSISLEAHLELDQMSIDEAIELLLHSSNRSGSLNQQNDKNIRAIAEELDCLPIALQQARSYMHETRCSANAYLERLRTSRNKLLAHPVKYQREMRYLSTYAAFDSSFGKLDGRTQRFLRLLSFLHWSKLPLELFTIAAKRSFSDYQDKYIDYGESYHVGTTLLKEIFLRDGLWDITNLDELTVSLQNYSLITLVPGVDTTLLEMHSLLHGWIHSCIPEQDVSDYQSGATVLLALGASLDYTPCKQYLPGHVMHLSFLWGKMHVNEFTAFGLILQDGGLYEGALQLQERAVTELRQQLPEDNVNLLDCLSQLADTYRYSGRLKEALILQEEVLRLRKEILGDRDQGTVEALKKLANIYFILGRHEEVLALDEEVLRLRIEISGRCHPETIGASSNLATSYHFLGRLEEALTIEKEALSLRKDILGEYHPSTITSLNNIAITYSDMERQDEALVLREEVLRLRKNILGERHPETLVASNNLANTYYNLGRYEEALLIQEDVMKSRKDTLGDRHPDTMLASSNLALTYRSLLRLDECLLLMEEVLRTRKEVLGERHPDTIVSSSNLALAYCDFGRLEEALLLQEGVLILRKNILGDGHRETCREMLNLAWTYISLSREVDALDLLNIAESFLLGMKQTSRSMYERCQNLKSSLQAGKGSPPSSLPSSFAPTSSTPVNE